MPHNTSQADDPIRAVHADLGRSRLDPKDLELTAQDVRNNPDQLSRSFRTLLRNDERLKRVAARSTFHPNGFAKVVLHTGGDCGVRLHVWHWHRQHRAGTLSPDPHGHRWEFASWIITGALRETPFDRVTDGEPFVRCEYGRRADGSAYLHPRRTEMLAPGKPIDRLAGTVYACASSVLHTAEPVGGGLVASLVFQGRRSRGATPVYLRPGEPRLQREQTLSVDELRALLAEVAAVVR
ncbi:MAG: hypothetical protein ACR2G2_11170 [Pseudonocardia sp.]